MAKRKAGAKPCFRYDNVNYKIDLESSTGSLQDQYEVGHRRVVAQIKAQGWYAVGRRNCQPSGGLR